MQASIMLMQEPQIMCWLKMMLLLLLLLLLLLCPFSCSAGATGQQWPAVTTSFNAAANKQNMQTTNRQTC
jgi:outer membrane lipoprotein-sorting protein